MIKIPFYTTEEKSPSHGDEIIVLFDRYEPRQVYAEYFWEGYDEDGQAIGESIGYDPETESDYKLGDTFTDSDVTYKLEWMTDIGVKDIAYWVSVDEYCKAFDELKNN